jgi:hypothetical protein
VHRFSGGSGANDDSQAGAVAEQPVRPTRRSRETR